MERVYLDHAATTPVDPEVAEAMTRVLRETHGNPSSIYAEGRAARALVDSAREQVADAISAHPSEVVFTSGGTEADNLALRGRLKVEDGRDGLVTSAIEHHAVIDTARDLAAHGQARLSVIGVDRHGLVDPEAIREAVDEQTSLVSVMHANNEIGTSETSESGRQSRLRDRIIAGVTGRIEDAVLTGHPTRRLPTNASFCIAGTEGESLIVGLDLEGFAVSSGSACTSGETEPSAVLLALGLDRELAKGSLRVTVGRETTEAAVDSFLAALARVVGRLRSAAAVTV